MFFRYRVLILVFVSVVFWGGQGRAQEDVSSVEEALPEGEGSAEFQDIRTGAETLLEENKALEAKHGALKKEFLNLQQDVDARKAEIADLETAQRSTAAVPPSSPAAEEQGGGLKRMQLDNLRYQKRELELEVRSRKILMEALQKQREEEIARLKQEDAELGERKKDLSRRLREIGNEAPAYPQEIERLTRENGYFKEEIGKLERMIRSEKKKKSLLKDDGELSTGRLFKETLAERERERKTLQAQIEDLKAKKTVLGKKGPLMDRGDLDRLRETARQIDEENQKLRSEIFSLRQKRSGSGL